MPLVTLPLGPFVRGVQQTRNPSIDPSSALKSARHWMYTGINQMSVLPGTAISLTLKDDAGAPADVTSVCHIGPFQDGALAIAHSTATQKVYLYRLPATMNGWYDSSGVLQTSLTPAPAAVLWTGMASAPDVSVTEGLGIAYISNTDAADVAGLYWPTKTFTGNSTIATQKANGTGGSAGSDDAYFNGVVAFKQHLWAFGYGAGSTPGYTSYRPELARFSQPNFGAFQAVDSITIGDRVRTQRERIIAGAVAGDALFLGGASLLSRVMGDGRDSWYRQVIDRSYGFVGPKCFVTVGQTLYYWSEAGPMRIADAGAPDPLWDAIPAAVATVANSAQIVAAFDLEHQQVRFFYDTGAGVRTFCAFDVRREVWLGPDADVGLALRCAGLIAPLYQSIAQAPIGPDAPPSITSSTGVGQTSATATWANGDAFAQTEISYRVQGGSTYTIAATLAAGVTTYGFSGLAGGTAYEWRVRHVKNGQFSTYDGPEAASQFTTVMNTLNPPYGLNGSSQYSTSVVDLDWINSDEEDVSTEIWEASPFSSNIFFKVQTVSPGVASASVTVPHRGFTYRFKVKHVRTGATDSDFSNQVFVSVT